MLQRHDCQVLVELHLLRRRGIHVIGHLDPGIHGVGGRLYRSAHLAHPTHPVKELAVELWNKAAKYQAEAAKLDNRKLPDIGNLPLWLRRSAYRSRGPQEPRLEAWLS